MSTTKTGFDFMNVEPTQSNKWLAPGQYLLQIENAKFEAPEGVNQKGEPKSPFITITFKGKLGQAEGKFFISANESAMGRLEYLHRGITKGKKIYELHPKPFTSAEDVGGYFVKMLMHDKVKQQSLRMIVGGKEGQDGRVFCDIPYSEFFIPDNVGEIEEGPYDVNSAAYANVIQRYRGKPANVPVSDETMLPSNSNDELDSLPF